MKFKVGEIYKDREGMEYRFIAQVPDAEGTQRLIFINLKLLDGVFRYSDGTIDRGAQTPYDIIPHEKKTVKLYPALYQTVPGRYYTDFLYETCPDDAIRLLTEYPPVVVEVEDE